MIAEELPDDWHDLKLYLPPQHVLSSSSSPLETIPLNHRSIDNPSPPNPFGARELSAAAANSELFSNSNSNFPPLVLSDARSALSSPASSLPSMSSSSSTNASSAATTAAVAYALALSDAGSSGGASMAISPLQALLVAALVLVIAGTAVGNFLVALSLLVVRRLRSQPANLLLLSLSVSDQLIALAVEPFALYKTVLAPDGWALGSLTCKVCITRAAAAATATRVLFLAFCSAFYELL